MTQVMIIKTSGWTHNKVLVTDDLVLGAIYVYDSKFNDARWVLSALPLSQLAIDKSRKGVGRRKTVIMFIK